MDNIDDEIGALAEKYLKDPDLAGLGKIDEEILRAQADRDWDMMAKWHRVRFRLLRIQRARWGGYPRIGPGRVTARE